MYIQGQRSAHKSSAQITAQMLNKHSHGCSIDHKCEAWTLVFIISSPSHSGYLPPGTSECSLCLLQPLTLLTISPKCGAQTKGFQFKIKSSRQKKEKDANVSTVSQPLSSWVTTADGTYASRVGTEPLVTCAGLQMSFRIISGHGTAAVWELWLGGGKRRLGIKGRKREREETQG